MQEVAIVLWRKFDELEQPDRFRPWAFGVARYEVLAWRRDKAQDRHVFGENLSGILADKFEASNLDQDKRIPALECPPLHPRADDEADADGRKSESLSVSGKSGARTR